MAKETFFLKNPGSGLLAKLCNNVLLAVNILMLSKCYALTKRSIDPAVLSEVFNASTGGSWANLFYCPSPGIVASAPSSNDFDTGFNINLMIKDLKLAREYFQTPVEINLILSSLIDAYENTKEFIGDIPKDFSIIYEYMKKFNATSVA